jgi:hypothetical protein
MRSEEVNEALLEAFFLKPLTDLMASAYGRAVFRVLKPSQQTEKFVGFDQGWARIRTGIDDFYRDLKVAIQTNSPSSHLYAGFFLQYKVPEKMIIRSKYMPSTWVLPANRCEISTEIDPATGLSQHDTLIRLRGMPGSIVSYAVPEVFDPDEIYLDPDLSKLRLFSLDTAPAYNDKKRHFIYFKPGSNSAGWCSDPVWFNSIRSTEIIEYVRPLSARKMMAFLRAVEEALPKDRRRRFPTSLRIVEFGTND